MPSLPDGLRIYAIGDIHGRADLLAELFELIKREQQERPPAASHLVFLGDYIDRGPDSPGVIEMLLHGLPAGFEADFLMGNHEQLLLDGLDDEAALGLWLANGGLPVIEAYAQAAGSAGRGKADWTRLSDMMPAEHLLFFRSLELSVRYGDYLFVHAGIRPGIALDKQDPHDLLWIRGPFLGHMDSFGVTVVHGHTPVPAPQIHPNRIAIDTGAVFTGRLTALVLEGERRDFLTT